MTDVFDKCCACIMAVSGGCFFGLYHESIGAGGFMVATLLTFVIVFMSDRK